MNSTLKTFLLIGLVIALVAAVTVVSQFGGGTTKTTPGVGPSGSEGSGGPPLTVPDAAIQYDPDSGSLAYRTFHGYFEVGDTVHWVSFWFKNEKPFPVKLKVGDPSCSTCTSARLAVVPDDALRDYAGRVALAGLPWSPVPLPDLISPAAYAAGVDARLAWQVFDFKHPDDTFTVPAGTPERPTVCLLSLGFKATAVGPPKKVTATLFASGPDERPHPYPFEVTYSQRPPFDLFPFEFPIGEIAEGAPARSFDVLIYSSTRKPAELPVPSALAGNDDPFVTIGKPVPMTAVEIEDLVRAAKQDGKINLRVTSGYRLTVTIHRDLPGKLADIGKFEKTVHFSIPGSNHTAIASFRGRVTGLIKLEPHPSQKDDKTNEEKIALGSYNSAFTLKTTRDIYSTRPDLELEIDGVSCAPQFVQYSLGPPRMEGGRKYWSITVTIPKETGRKPAWEGVVFLKAKGKDGTRANIRLPVSGNGIGR